MPETPEQKARHEITKTYSLQHNDLVINRVNSMTRLGKCLVVSESYKNILLESNMMRGQLSISIHPQYMEFYLRSGDRRQQLTKNAKQATQPSFQGRKRERAVAGEG